MKFNVFAILLSAILVLSSLNVSAQMGMPDEGAPGNWFTLDYNTDKYRGVSVEKTYNEILKGKKASKVVVAIIDSGVDIEHEDLKDVIWKNEDEIAGNGKDDDNNGYVDDMHGWNFIGGKNGTHVEADTYEITRLYKKYKAQFEGKSPDAITDQAGYKLYLQYKKAYEVGKTEKETEYGSISMFVDAFNNADKELIKHFGKEDYTLDEVKTLESDNEELQKAQQNLLLIYSLGLDKAQMKEIDDYYTKILKFSYNLDFDPREIVGDNYDDLNEKYYGNNDVKGPSCDHGTHVSGIVAASRGNNIGIDGIADNVSIMVLRVVPDGDERDKDIANAVRYAADNGARIINMSFGKLYSPHKNVVDEAFKYAESKGVLMIHAAGNESDNNDKIDHYPTRYLLNSAGEIKNWIEVGASSWGNDDKFVAEFSNYGKKTVDIFAPGVDINSTFPENGYKEQSGTSMAAPVVTGVAALLLSYYPQLTALQLKDAILKSASDYANYKVNAPSEGEKTKMVKFKKLSRTGKIINAYNAAKYVETNFK